VLRPLLHVKAHCQWENSATSLDNLVRKSLEPQSSPFHEPMIRRRNLN